ncbi:hypothetical protein QNN03_38120 [Streptomyces sp. GXMU-J15]|uniref:SMI1/KNR4 family protein n=1 Tax=Streptomyces fuscus TaxID=3048495 RepID=A0ABT7JBS6_9ACTN|nr:hypothetical protein [Streptomyces fuscus]MDL2082235.1 hypothetical protein [Streptomyces fuscus]
MSSLHQLKQLLGVPRDKQEGSLAPVEEFFGIELPAETKECLSLYGDLLISDFIAVYGPEFITEKNAWMREFLKDGHSVIPKGVLPDAGGMLYWGHSVEGDGFFLEDRGGGRWTVSAFRRNWGDWYQSDDNLVDWLVGVFSGRIAADWMPEWPDIHWFE